MSDESDARRAKRIFLLQIETKQQPEVDERGRLLYEATVPGLDFKATARIHGEAELFARVAAIREMLRGFPRRENG